MPGRYATDTAVSSDKSKAEIERTLSRYGADQFMYGTSDGQAIVAFRAQDRHVKFLLPLPDRNDLDFRFTPSRRLSRTDAQREQAYEQATRQCWRALNLVIKAKLEAIEAGIATFDDEFLAYLMLPDGETVGEWFKPQLAASYVSGAMPLLGLPAPRRR